MKVDKIYNGKAHKTPTDLKVILKENQDILYTWNDLTVLSRNEWICWITSAKKIDTRERRLNRLVENLSSGKRRPCCWSGCPHRK